MNCDQAGDYDVYYRLFHSIRPANAEICMVSSIQPLEPDHGVYASQQQTWWKYAAGRHTWPGSPVKSRRESEWMTALPVCARP